MLECRQDQTVKHRPQSVGLDNSRVSDSDSVALPTIPFLVFCGTAKAEVLPKGELLCCLISTFSPSKLGFFIAHLFIYS